MKRRDILKYTALATGAALSAPLLLSLSACSSDKGVGNSFEPSFFDGEEFKFVQKLIDIILPRTDSPSASDVGVHQIIDEMLSQVYSESDQKAYYANFKALYKHFNPGLSLEEKHVTALEKHSETNIRDAFKDLKQQTIAYYLSTEEVGTNFLNYLPLPGEYEGCIALEDVGGKAWAL